MKGKVKQNGADEDSIKIKTAIANIIGPIALNVFAEKEREQLVKEMDLYYQMWKWERERNSVPTEHFHTWKGIVDRTPNFSWTIKGIPTNPKAKWSFSQEYSPTLGCSLRIKHLKHRPLDVGIELLYKEYVDLLPKPKLFVALRGKGGVYTDALATKVFVYGEMLKKDFESHFLCAVFPKILLVHSGYNTNNSVTLDFYLEQHWSTQFVQSCGGNLLWKIENFSKLIEENPDIEFLSPYFYTTPRGYRIQAIMCRTETRLSVKIVFLNGISDAFWQRKINYNLKITITTPDLLTCMGEYTRYNFRGLAFCHHLGKLEDLAIHNTICLKIEINMN